MRYAPCRKMPDLAPYAKRVKRAMRCAVVDKMMPRYAALCCYARSMPRCFRARGCQHAARYERAFDEAVIIITYDMLMSSCLRAMRCHADVCASVTRDDKMSADERYARRAMIRGEMIRRLRARSVARRLMRGTGGDVYVARRRRRVLRRCAFFIVTLRHHHIILRRLRLHVIFRYYDAIIRFSRHLIRHCHMSRLRRCRRYVIIFRSMRCSRCRFSYAPPCRYAQEMILFYVAAVCRC